MRRARVRRAGVRRALCGRVLLGGVLVLGAVGLVAPGAPPRAAAASVHDVVGTPTALHWRVTPLGGVRGHPWTGFWLDGVACPSPSFCLLVGEEQERSSDVNVVEHFDGRTWSRLAIGLSSDGFSAVSCASVRYCMVVGENASNHRLALLYDGGRWTRHVLPGRAAFEDAVDCPVVGTCVLMAQVGTYATHLQSDEFVHGTWRALPMRGASDWGIGSVASLSCVRPTDCAAVGHYGSGGPAGSGFVLDLTGTTWRVAEVQSAEEYRGGFGNVSCASTGTCVATEDLSWPLQRDADGLAGFLAQGRRGGRWTSLGRGLPASAQLIVAQAGVQCFAEGGCLVTAASNTGMFTGTVEHGRLAPLAVVHGIRLHGVYPWLTSLSCATPSFCVQVSDSYGAPYVLVGTS